MGFGRTLATVCNGRKRFAGDFMPEGAHRAPDAASEPYPRNNTPFITGIMPDQNLVTLTRSASKRGMAPPKRRHTYACRTRARVYNKRAQDL